MITVEKKSLAELVPVLDEKEIRPILLIFEGLDGSGKTTLRHELLKYDNRFLVWDRGPASQYVYGILCDKINTPSKEALYMLERTIKEKFQVYYIYTFAPNNALAKRMEEKGEDMFFIHNIDWAKDLYMEYLINTPIEVIMINTAYDDIEGCVRKILELFAE